MKQHTVRDVLTTAVVSAYRAKRRIDPITITDRSG
jgi:hypothetical protein